MEKTSERRDVIELDVPQIEGSGMLSLIYRLYSMLGAVIADAENSQHFKFEMLTNLLINTVLDRDVRAEIKDFKKNEMIRRLDELDSPGQEEINSVHMEVCLDAIGEVTTFIDRHLGVSVKLEVGTV